ncbi:MAG: DUF4115 domain-containing protein [Desulfovibrio sp.]|jgi:cytoskeleton protein RodZ|nr:DUF4115 domain-containing protein [Desulfovibrio sp.]
MTLEELGSTLRYEREKRALSIDEISEILKIGTPLLRALEEGDASSLPHQTYTRGFIRSYASFLEINSAAIHIDTITTQGNVYLPWTSRNPKKKCLAPLIILLFIIAGGIAIAWRLLHTTLRTTPNRLAEPALAPLHPGLKAPAAGADAAAVKSQLSWQRNQSDSRPGTDAETPAVEPSQVTQKTDAALAPTHVTHNVIVTATEECWIYLKVDTDTRQFSMNKDDTFALTFQKKLELKLGNAGGVRIRYDGQDLPGAGKSGQVRTLTFPPGQD